MRRRTKLSILALTLTTLCSFIVLHRTEKTVIIKVNDGGQLFRQVGKAGYTQKSTVDKSINITTLTQENSLTVQSVQKKVVILSYIRSGSELIGDLLQHSHGVFYVFEPLLTTEKFFNGHFNQSEYRLLDNSHLQVPIDIKELRYRYIKVLNAFLNCQFQEIDVPTLMQDDMLMSNTTKEFRQCAVNKTDLARLNICKSILFTKCLNARIVVIKITQLSMEHIDSITALNEHVKIIHLIRDPRGALGSQQSLMFQSAKVTSDAANFCDRINQNIQESKRIFKIFPNRILTVRYEDITDFPTESSRQIYSFLDLDFTASIKEYIWNITYIRYTDSCETCTTRNNIATATNKWRLKLPIKIIFVIQQQCIKVFNIMGYNMFNTRDDLMEFDRLSHKRSYSLGLMKVQTKNVISKYKTLYTGV